MKASVFLLSFSSSFEFVCVKASSAGIDRIVASSGIVFKTLSVQRHLNDHTKEHVILALKTIGSDILISAIGTPQREQISETVLLSFIAKGEFFNLSLLAFCSEVAAPSFELLISGAFSFKGLFSTASLIIVNLIYSCYYDFL